MRIFTKDIKKSWMYFLILLVTLWLGCRKANFVEPPDPFAPQQLEANPDIVTLGQGPNALVVKTNHANILQTQNGIRVKGTLFIQNNKYGDMPLTSGDFELVKDTAGMGKGLITNDYSDISGMALADIPHEGLLKTFQMTGMSALHFGFKKGSDFDLGAFQWPVNKDRYYFYFENSGGPLQATLDGSSFNLIQKIAIDPTDPFVFFQCNLDGTSLGETLSDIGFAVSVQGFIPFTPAVDLGGIKGFNGNLYIEGTIPIKDYDIALTGEACVGFNSGDPDGIKNFFSGKMKSFNLGINGKCTLNNDVLDFLNVEVVLGKATVTLSYDKGGKAELKFAGERDLPSETVSDFLAQMIGHDWNFLDYLIPVSQKETFYGTVGNVISDWQLGYKMQTTLKLPGVDPLDMGTSQLEVSTSHMYFFGEAVVGGFVRIGVEGEAQKSGDFKLTGFAKSGFKYSSGILSIGYDLGMSVTLQLQEVSGKRVFTFNGQFHFDGRACVNVGKIHICASVHFKGSATISSDGSYKFCFSIGVGKYGFDVCISQKRSNSSVRGKPEFIGTMTSTEIPLKLVPENMRFPAEECAVPIK